MTNLNEFDPKWIDTDGEYQVYVSDIKRIYKTDDVEFFATLTTDNNFSIKQKFTLNAKFGWKVKKLAEACRLSSSQIMAFEPEMLIGRWLTITVVKGDEYCNITSYTAPKSDAVHVPEPSTEDVPF
jgi:hypothetical protein